MLMRTVLVVGAIIAMTGVLEIAMPTNAEAQRRPPTTCYRERSLCLQSNTQRGPNGQLYVPPDANARCQALFRHCMTGR